jgi:hypothetical protein
MHRSSESIASLAAALAKAQVLLTNPEKSLTATVGTDRYGEPGRPFRYAPLSSGLDIVRKALGQHGIATLQTTAIDQATQTVSLTRLHQLRGVGDAKVLKSLGRSSKGRHYRG